MAKPARIHESRLHRGQEPARENTRELAMRQTPIAQQRSADESLRLQIARWVNEGGAGEDPSLPVKFRSFSQNINTAP